MGKFTRYDFEEMIKANQRSFINLAEHVENAELKRFERTASWHEIWRAGACDFAKNVFGDHHRPYLKLERSEFSDKSKPKIGDFSVCLNLFLAIARSDLDDHLPAKIRTSLDMIMSEFILHEWNDPEALKMLAKYFRKLANRMEARAKKRRE